MDEAGNVYNQDYVDLLERQHKERMEETLEAARRVLSIKDQEVQKLQDKVKGLEEEHKIRESRLRNELESLQSRAADFEKSLKSMKQIHLDEIRTLMRSHNDLMETLRKEHQQRMEETKRERDEQIRAVQINRDAILEALRTHQQDNETQTTARIASLTTAYQAKVRELQSALALEMDKAEAARQELDKLTQHLDAEAGTLNVKVAELEAAIGERETALKEKEKQLEDLDNQHELEVKRVMQDFIKKESIYESEVRTIRQDQRTERERMHRLLQQSDAHLRDMENKLAQVQANATKEQQSMEQNEQELYKKVEEARQTLVEQDRKTREVMLVVQQLQKENRILRDELLLLDAPPPARSRSSGRI